MENKKEYIAPQLTTVSFNVENGFVLSGNQVLDQMILWDNSDDSQQVEDYQQHSIWNDGNGFWN